VRHYCGRKAAAAQRIDVATASRDDMDTREMLKRTVEVVETVRC